jgi:undecaprenyl-diphosphatase
MPDLNLQLFHWINFGPQAPAVLLGLARLSSTALPLAFLAGMGGALFLRDAAVRRALTVALLALALAWLVSRGLSALWPTPRPFVLGVGHQWLEHKPTPSFPSSHASAAFAAGFALWRRLRHPVWRWLPLGVAALVAWSRVALGLHFPLDALAGLGVGLLSSWLACHAMSLRGGAWVMTAPAAGH